ncbi:hypothetical protein [Streptomyces lunalinharesii]|uniref:Uncharacterized protein n=1 Tax=Streptomyces lunalinharesii TaxID=333384 RepID=A0ABP6FJZ5_9ACTN
MPAPLNLHFHDAQHPGLTAGEYTVTVTQKLVSSDHTELGQDFFRPLEQPVHVEAPRFTLGPSLVHAVNPASGAAGRFDQTFAHCTLRQPSLPWQRVISAEDRHKNLPWLALLVLGPSEIHEDPAAEGLATPRLGADVPKPESHVAVPALTPTAVEATRPCRTIDVIADAFTQVCPRDTDDELAHLAHVRKVKPHHSTRGEDIVEGDFAVVLASRLPKATGHYVAHLVSLEGHGQHLSGTLPGGTQRVRLVSLWSWTFAFDGKIRHFPAVVTRLAAGDLLLRRPLTVPMDSGAAEKEVSRRLRRGYVALPSRMSSGEQTLAWYRGPLTPVVAPGLPEPPDPACSGDHAAIYLPEHGMFDISYASAWSLGRALALSDADYVASLTGWQHTARAVVTRMLAAGPPESGRWQAPASPRERLASCLDRGLSASIDAALSSATPAEEPAARPWGRGDHITRLLDDRPDDVLHALAAAGAEAGELSEARSWLDRLDVLEQVPFAYLVPDAGMLPPESLRFFHIDPAWLSHLRAGASSPGCFGGVERLAERTLTAIPPPLPPRAGLLLRSSLVCDCPDLVIEAFGRAEATQILRRACLSADVLLCLFETVPKKVVLREPAQGLHFGIDGPDTINLREPGGKNCGKEIPGKTLTGLTSYQRDVKRAVFTLGTGNSSLTRALAKQHNIAPQSFKSSDLAIQLLNSPYQITFPSA